MQSELRPGLTLMERLRATDGEAGEDGEA